MNKKHMTFGEKPQVQDEQLELNKNSNQNDYKPESLDKGLIDKQISELTKEEVISVILPINKLGKFIKEKIAKKYEGMENRSQENNEDTFYIVNQLINKISTDTNLMEDLLDESLKNDFLGKGDIIREILENINLSDEELINMYEDNNGEDFNTYILREVKNQDYLKNAILEGINQNQNYIDKNGDTKLNYNYFTAVDAINNNLSINTLTFLLKNIDQKILDNKKWSNESLEEILNNRIQEINDGISPDGHKI